MSTFSDSLDFGDSNPIADSTGPFVDDVSAGYDSQQTDLDVESPIFINGNDSNSSFNAGDTLQPSICGDCASGRSDGPNLLPASEMMSEEAFALREWRRENAIRLEEKEKMEKEILNQIIEEAEEYKVEFYRKRVITCENKKATNREREEIYVANQKMFHEEANKNYWKSIAELIPNEVASLGRRKGKKDQQENKPSVTVLQGPKAGKPTDLSHMRQILLKLKHNAPTHLKPSPAPVEAEDAKTVATSAEVEVAA